MDLPINGYCWYHLTVTEKFQELVDDEVQKNKQTKKTLLLFFFFKQVTLAYNSMQVPMWSRKCLRIFTFPFSHFTKEKPHFIRKNKFSRNSWV